MSTSARAATAQPPTPRPAPAGEAGPLRAIGQTVREFFSLDVRTLALFRVGLAYLLLADLANRWPDLTALYSDEGAVPRIDFFHVSPRYWLLDTSNPFSLHVLGGSHAFQVALHLLACAFAVGLLVGYRTQFMTLVSWFLLMSSQARNPAVMHGGDLLLRLLAFWGIFLPLGAYFSFDAATTARRLNRQYRVCNPASAALILQVCFVYWFAVAWKSGAPWREEGSAVYYALSVDGFSTRFAHFLLNFPVVMKLLTRATMVLELFGPVLLFIPFANGLLRTLAVASFIAFHAGLGVCLELGFFPPTCWLAWIALLPTWFWDKLGTRFDDPAREGLVVYYDAGRRAAGKAAARLRTFLLLDGAELVPLAQDEARQAAAAKRNSWLVVAGPGKDRFGYEAVVHLARLSPLFFPVAGLLTWWPPRAVGEWVFRRIGGSRLVAGPPEPAGAAPAVPAPGLVQNALVLFLLVYVFAINVRTLPSISRWALLPLSYALDSDVQTLEEKFREKTWLPDMAMNLAATLGLDQSWGVFAPQPGTLDGWYVIVGTLKNGRQANLFTGGYPLDGVEIVDAIPPSSWEKPELISAEYANSRWRKYLINLYGDLHMQLRPYYVDYLCREWNARHSGGEELALIEMYFMAERTNPPDTPYIPPEKWLLIRFDCTRRKWTIPPPGGSPS
jgi:hypothetical protein